METELAEGGFLHFIPLAYGLSRLIPLRKNFSNSDAAFFKAFGGYGIGKMTVCRTPLNDVLGTTLNILSLGKWQKAVKQYGYDKMFHLFLTLDLIPPGGGQTITALFEKTQTPILRQMRSPIPSNSQCMPVQNPYNGTLFDFIKATQAQMGDDFWRYNAFSNNCQLQIINALGANGLLTAQLQAFIKQDVEGIAKQIPSLTKDIVQGITDTARGVRTLTGSGLCFKDKHTIGI